MLHKGAEDLALKKCYVVLCKGKKKMKGNKKKL